METASLKLKFTSLFQNLQQDSNHCLEIIPEITYVKNLNKIKWKKEKSYIEYIVPVTYRVILRKNESKSNEDLNRTYYSCVNFLLPSSDEIQELGNIKKILSDTFLMTNVPTNTEKCNTILVPSKWGKEKDGHIISNGYEVQEEINSYTSVVHKTPGIESFKGFDNKEKVKLAKTTIGNPTVFRDMATESVIDQIVKSLSFQVEATPQDDENTQATSTSNATPLNVKIKVRKKHDSNIDKAMLSVPKFGNPGSAPERVRLISSDQTIMSFNVLMEADFAKQGKKRPRKHLFGGCLGTQYDDDDSPYVPSSKYNVNKAETNIISKSEAVLRENFTLSKNPQNHINPELPLVNHGILGKCKPGGCLDPPFSEDKYSYRPVNKNELVTNTPKTELKNKNSKKIKRNFFKSHLKADEDEKTGAESVLNLYKTDRLGDSMDTQYSDSIITYPPEINSSTNFNEKILRPRISSEEKQRRSFNEGSEVFYSPTKIYRREEYKERKKDDKTFSNSNVIEEINNRKKNIPISGKSDEMSVISKYSDALSKSTKLSKQASIDQILQENKINANLTLSQKPEIKTSLANENLDNNSVTYIATSKAINNSQNSHSDLSYKVAVMKENTYTNNRLAPSETSSNDLNVYKSRSIETNYDQSKDHKATESVSNIGGNVINQMSLQSPNNQLNQTENYITLPTLIDTANENKIESLMKPQVVRIDQNKLNENNNKTEIQDHLSINTPFINAPVESVKSCDKIKHEKEKQPSDAFIDTESEPVNQKDNDKFKSYQESHSPTSIDKSALIGKSDKAKKIGLNNSSYNGNTVESENKSHSDSLVSIDFDKKTHNKVIGVTEELVEPILSSDIKSIDKIMLVNEQSKQQDILSEYKLTPVNSHNDNVTESLIESGSNSLSKIREDHSKHKISTGNYNKVIIKTDFKESDAAPSFETNKEFDAQKDPGESNDLKRKDEEPTNLRMYTGSADKDSISSKQNFNEIKDSTFESNQLIDTFVRTSREQFSEIMALHEPIHLETALVLDNNQTFNKPLYQNNKTEPNILSTGSNNIEISQKDISNRESFQSEAFRSYVNETSTHEMSSPKYDVVYGLYTNNEESKKMSDEISEKMGRHANYPEQKPTIVTEKHLISNIDPRLEPSINTYNEGILLDDKDRFEVLEGYTENTINKNIINNDQNEKSKTIDNRDLNTDNSNFTLYNNNIDVNNQTKKYPYTTPRSVSSGIDNILSEKSNIISDIKAPLHVNVHKNMNHTSKATKSLDRIHSKESTSKSSSVLIKKSIESYGDKIKQEYDSSKTSLKTSADNIIKSTSKTSNDRKWSKDSYASLRSALKNEVISLNMGFKSYTNGKKEKFVETFDVSKEPSRKSDDVVTLIRAQIRPHINDIRIPIDSENEMSIQICRSKSPLRVQIKSNEQSNDEAFPLRFPQKHEPALTDKEIQELLNSVYERDLIPLQKAFKYLKQDVAMLANQQLKFKERGICPKRSKSIRVVKVNPKCCCWRK